MKRFLERSVRGDPELRAKVAALLDVYANAGSFLESPPPEVRPTLDVPPIREAPGSIIGRYKLLQQIGEGGFGVVFMAEQQEPVRRQVALKIIKPGMDTKEVIARFEAERQALGPDGASQHCESTGWGEHGVRAGRTLSWSWFGESPLQNTAMTTRCAYVIVWTFRPQYVRAIQHAHQKGIIHRDIKPSNVLITLHDGRPVPKVIDFGIAKATNQRLTEQTLFTRFSDCWHADLYESGAGGN